MYRLALLFVMGAALWPVAVVAAEPGPYAVWASGL